MQKRLLYIALLVTMAACKENANDNPNPYNKPDNDVYTGVDSIFKEPQPNTIAWLHKYIFKPTCANSGCHDGNFEPDFRSVQSSYNTLVNQPIIKNDAINPLTARVTPGNDATSMLIKRLEIDLNGNSGIMPLVTEPGSDWKTKKDDYIQSIKTWINNGCLDLSGNPPKPLDFPPQLQGMVAYVNGTLQPRYGQYAPVEVAAGSNVDLWFSLQDDITPMASIGTLKVNFSLEANNFNPANEKTFTYSTTAKAETGYYKQPVNFYHTIALNASQLGNAGDVIWVRITVDDGVNPATEIPSNNSLFNAKKYYAIRLK